MENAGLSIVGVGKDREENDFYPTPIWAVEELLKREKFEGNIWECACGEGNISNALIKEKYKVISSDLIDRGVGYRVDFLKYSGKSFDNIITNPPFKDGLKFVLQAKKFSKKKIGMFLKTVFLESKERYEMFIDKEYPLKCIYQFSGRVTLTKGGIKCRNSGLVAYAWYIWDKNYVGEPTIRWICN